MTSDMPPADAEAAFAADAPSTEPDRAEAERFLPILDPDAGSFTFQTFDDDKERAEAYKKAHNGRPDPRRTRVIHGSLDQCWDQLKAINERGNGVFITVNETDGAGRKETNIKRVRALFLDMDGAPLEPLLQWRKPHMVVETSPGKFHPYLLTTNVSLDAFRGMQKALIAKFGGDPAVHDLPRVMRLPGFLHRKGAPALVRVVETNDVPPYDAADLAVETNGSADVREMLKKHAGEGVEPVESSPWQELNTAALANLSAWVPDLFGDGARPSSNGGYRVSSKALNRELQEDLSIHPDGIKDFGVHDMGDAREGRRSPIDVVMEHGRKGFEEAVDWLRAKLGMDVPKQQRDFETDSHGHRLKTQRNIRKGMELLGVKVSYDMFHDRMLISGLEGHDKVDDAAVVKLWLTIEERFRFLPSKDFFFAVVEEAARRNSFHPVRDYLDGLTWDGVARLGAWLITYGRAKDTPYVRAVGKIVLVAAVRRVRQPGCKFDEMLILESEQGKEKSVMLSILAVKSDWFSDDLPLNADGKKAIEQLRGRWIVEAAEMSGIRKADVEHLKAFLSRQEDRARLAYDRVPSQHPRECVVVGTTNEEVYLKDITGKRRFWPVKTPKFDIEALRRDRDQLWAEAAALEKEGTSIRLTRRSGLLPLKSRASAPPPSLGTSCSTTCSAT